MVWADGVATSSADRSHLLRRHIERAAASSGEARTAEQGLAELASAATPADGREEVEGEVLGQQGFVVADMRRCGNLILTHLVTHERVTVKDVAEWDLAFDPDSGAGALVVVSSASGSASQHDLDCLFKVKLIETVDGRRFILDQRRRAATQCVWRMSVIRVVSGCVQNICQMLCRS